ncbi:GxxExxY protein [Guyparkeria halophila]|uniref:GxxExxY protein n=1 Tax=Guyparkeria halophila TaxID=47960 RepID=A0ABZ0YYW7_9GAMM|nr:GxxExxY protein [Guyparkeria halophila]WQH17370.1 GxxExxY protein [Guyparkeria halophila]
MLECEDLTYAVRGAIFEVSRELGAGFLESVYEKSLAHERTVRGLGVERQMPVTTYYKQVAVGQHVLDLLVEDQLVIELKAVRALVPEHEAQLLHYLKATGYRLGLLVNFTHPKAQVKRLIR